MESLEDLMTILIDERDVFISYSDFVCWLLNGENIQYLSQYESIPSWLIIRLTWYGWESYCKDEIILEFMDAIDKFTSSDIDHETNLRRRLFLFHIGSGSELIKYNDLSVFNETVEENIEDCDLLWDDYFRHFPGYLKDNNKITEYDDRLIQMANNDHNLRRLIQEYFTLPSEEYISEIVLLLDAAVNIGTDDKNIYNMLPSLEIDNYIAYIFERIWAHRMIGFL